MAGEYEAQIETETAHRALHELGVFSIKVKAAQERGYNDRIFLIPTGIPLFIEFKRPGESPTPYQTLIHERLRHANYKTEVHTSVTEALNSIRKAMDAGRGATARRGMATISQLRRIVSRSRSR